jgi:hypothetical protein
MIRRWVTGGSTYRCRSVPVWHFHESLGHLQNLATRFDLVALGSSGQWPNPGSDDWWGRIAEALQSISGSDGRPRCKLHGLRMLNPAIFTRCPFASADSTNAVQNAGASARFGMYTPPTAWQRATIIADRIESLNSSPVFLGVEQYGEGLFA